MKFIDSNIFLHAILIPRRKLEEKEQRVKDGAKAIIKRIEEGEEVATTTIHLSEVINIIETGLSLEKSLSFLTWIVTCKKVIIYPVSKEDYGNAAPLATENLISANDAIAYLLMKKYGIKEIYSFDKHYESFKDIVKLPKI